MCGGDIWKRRWISDLVVSLKTKFVIARFMRATHFSFLRPNWVARTSRAMTFFNQVV
jgi:hypothetical protein